jgi:hypothetical protein
MDRNLWPPILGWGVMLTCAYISGSILWGALRLPSLTGSGAAQADLGLYLAARQFGLPVTLISIVVVTGALIAARRRVVDVSSFYGFRALMALGVFNILVAPGVMAWILWL